MYLFWLSRWFYYMNTVVVVSNVIFGRFDGWAAWCGRGRSRDTISCGVKCDIVGDTEHDGGNISRWKISQKGKTVNGEKRLGKIGFVVERCAKQFRGKSLAHAKSVLSCYGNLIHAKPNFRHSYHVLFVLFPCIVCRRLPTPTLSPFNLVYAMFFFLSNFIDRNISLRVICS